MPVVINEVVFKATIAEPGAARPPRSAPGDRPLVDGDALIAACVEEVLRILERRKER